MAFHQILSEKELEIAPVGLYVVAGKDGAPIDDVRDRPDLFADNISKDVPVRLMARVRDGGELPEGINSFQTRADGKQVLTDWVPISVIEHSANDAPPSETPTPTDTANVEAVPCPNCGAPLTNTVIQSITVCPKCGRSIAFIDGSATLATGTHTVPLSADTIKALKQQRPAKVRA